LWKETAAIFGLNRMRTEEDEEEKKASRGIVGGLFFSPGLSARVALGHILGVT